MCEISAAMCSAGPPTFIRAITRTMRIGCARPASPTASAVLEGAVGRLAPALGVEQPVGRLVAARVRLLVVELEPAERVDALVPARDPQRIARPLRRGPAAHVERRLLAEVVGRQEPLGDEDPRVLALVARPVDVAV